MDVDAEQVASLLAGMSYPAQLWEIAAWADHNGAGHPAREALLNIPSRAYASAEDIARSVQRARPGTVAPLRPCHHRRHPKQCCGNDWHYQLDELAS